MKNTNSSPTLHWCQKALVAALALLGMQPLHAQNGPPGELDPRFGSGGQLTTDFFQASEQINALAAMQDGRFVAAGTVTGPNAQGQGSSPNFAVARYLPDGRLDPSFGNNGLVAFDRSGNVDGAYSVAVLPDRSVLLAGIVAPSAYSDFALAKLRPDGSFDTSFGSPAVGGRSGYVLLDVVGASFHDEGRHLALQRDGKIIVAGNTLVTVGNFMYRRVTVARFSADGVLDTSFGGANRGYVVLDSFNPTDTQSSDYVSGIALGQDGYLPADDRITLVGYTFARNNAFVARLTRDGAVDTSFGSGSGSARSGRITLSSATSGGVTTGVSELRAGRLDSAGRVVLVGTANDRGLAFLRLLPDGSPDLSFGSNGRTLVKLSSSSNYDEPAALALQGNGKIVASGFATTAPAGTPQKDFFVVRLSANGQADAGFGDGQGRKAVAVSTTTDESLALAVEPSGNLLVGGYALRAGTSQYDFAILRAYGDPDRIFAHDFEQPF